MDFAGPGKPLTRSALDQAGDIIGIPAEAMWAVIHVERRQEIVHHIGTGDIAAGHVDAAAIRAAQRDANLLALKAGYQPPFVPLIELPRAK